MPTESRSGANVELKLHLTDRHEAARVLAELGAVYDDTIAQIDTYYDSAGRRLKTREEPGRPPVVIVYNRPDATTPATSEYTIHPLEKAPAEVRADMREVIAVVRKRREVWLYENVRIHLDSVDDLGEFLEFEAIIDESRDEVASRVIVDQLLESFRDAVGDVLGVSNLDLMLARNGAGAPTMSRA